MADGVRHGVRDGVTGAAGARAETKPRIWADRRSKPRITVGTISAADHLTWLRTQSSVSFLQTPAWAQVKSEWRSESLGWFDGDDLVGTALVLLRKVPRMSRYLAYIPEGPIIDWERALTVDGLDAWLRPMVTHLKVRGAFAIKMGPPLAVRAWHAPTIKAALASEDVDRPMRLRDVSPDQAMELGLIVGPDLRALGWSQPVDAGSGFGDVQPRYVFQIPLARRTQDDLLAGFNQQWRRNLRRAESSGVEVTYGTREDLAAFHEVYVETAERDGFRPRPLTYFERMWDALSAEDAQRIRLHLALHDGEVAAGAIRISVGTHSWYSYGASTTKHRDVRASNAMQWHMMCEALAEGRTVYDMRGISDSLDVSEKLTGLLQFKVGTGGYALEYVGEWDLPVRPVLAWAVSTYLRRT